MGLLGLSIPYQEADGSSHSLPSACSCDCSGGGGFYKKVAGLKGPKCEKEMKRLDGWIDLYRRERREPARLAHLMIGKAVALSGESGGGFEGVEFPATVEGFLERDPATKKER